MLTRAAISKQLPNLGIKKANYTGTSTTIPKIILSTLANEQQATAQVAPIAHKFRGANDIETCRNIWQFLRTQVPYKEDQENQIIKLPGELVRKGGDCKSMSLFTMALLNNLGIKGSYKHGFYNASEPWKTHIYITTKHGAIDGTWKDPLSENPNLLNPKIYGSMSKIYTVGNPQVGSISKNDIITQIVKDLGSSKISAVTVKLGRKLANLYGFKGFMRGYRTIMLFAFSVNLLNIAKGYQLAPKKLKDLIELVYYALGGSTAAARKYLKIGATKQALTKDNFKRIADSNIKSGKWPPSGGSLFQIYKDAKVGSGVEETLVAVGGVLATVLAIVEILDSAGVFDKKDKGGAIDPGESPEDEIGPNQPRKNDSPENGSGGSNGGHGSESNSSKSGGFLFPAALAYFLFK